MCGTVHLYRRYLSEAMKVEPPRTQQTMHTRQTRRKDALVVPPVLTIGTIDDPQTTKARKRERSKERKNDGSLLPNSNSVGQTKRIVATKLTSEEDAVNTVLLIYQLATASGGAMID